AAGLLTPEACKRAGDPDAFPEQVSGGLRPWQALKVYIGGLHEDEDFNVGIDPGVYSPWLGESYENLARTGLSFQRSQTSGRLVAAQGPVVERYKRVASAVGAPDREKSFFDGIDTSLPALFKTLGRPAPSGASEALGALDRETAAALAAFRVEDPAACVPALARALAAARRAQEASAAESDAAFVLKTKERQVMDALEAALGLDFVAAAQPTGIPDPSGPYAAF